MSLPFFVLTAKQKVSTKKVSHYVTKDTSGIVDLAADNRNKIEQVISNFPCRDDVMSFLDENAGLFGRMNIIMVVLTVNLLMDAEGDLEKMIHLFDTDEYSTYRQHFTGESSGLSDEKLNSLFQTELKVYTEILMSRL